MDDSPKLSSSQILQLVWQEAQHKALLSLVETIITSIGLTSIDGLPPAQWYQKQVRDLLEKHVLAIGDSNPPLAAELQKLIDGLKLPPV
jgi:hypothetical protein